MLSPWILHTLTLPSLLASSVSCIALSHMRVGANFAGASKPRDMIRSFTRKPPYIFLKKATIPTYYGISIAIPRYIAMQLSTIPLLWHVSSLSYCFAWSCSWHRIYGKATIHIFYTCRLLSHCTSRYTAEGIHIESYFVLVSSCNHWVVNKLSFFPHLCFKVAPWSPW